MSPTIREARKYAAQRLQAHGIPDPAWDADMLLSSVTGYQRLELSLRPLEALTDQQERQLSALLLSRVEREPLQYLLGKAGFFGRDFRVDHRVLIPRPETELLCEKAIEALTAVRAARPQPFVLDLCTGSGAIGVTLALECPFAQVSACDLSPEALSLARQNAQDLGAAVDLKQGNLFEAVTGRRFDMIISNPPYIPQKELAGLQEEVRREPQMALDGGEDGLDFYRRIAKEAPEYLNSDGWLLLEIGDGQGEAVKKMLLKQGFQRVTVFPDDQGLERMVTARWPGFPSQTDTELDT